MKQQLLRPKPTLTDKEKACLVNMESARAQAHVWMVREIKHRDNLIISLHQRLPHAVWEISRVLGVSHAFVKGELQRLFQSGKLKRKWKGDR